MTKEEFIKKLKNKIRMLDQKEIDDIISEYEGFIEEKKSSGMSEKEAVKSLGDINEIAKDLLSAYKIDDDYSDLSGKEVIDSFMDKTIETIDNTVKAVENKSLKGIIKMIIEVLLLLLIIRICKFPVDVLLDIAKETFNLLGNNVGHYIFNIFSFIVNIIYFILAVIFFFRILKEKIIGNEAYEEIKLEKESKSDSKTKKEEKKVNNIKEPKEKSRSIIDLFAEIILCFIKFIVGCIAFGNILFIVAMSSVLAVLIYSLIKGITYFGPLFIAIALLIFGICFLEVFIRFIFNQKQRVIRFIITLIASLLIGGIGIGIFSIEIANTTITDKIPQSNIISSEEVYDMEDNVVISSYLVNDKNYIVDEELKDKIKIEYTYNNRYVDLNSDTYVDNYDDYKIYNLNYTANWSKKSLKKLIDDLKNKKLYNITHDIEIKIYTSSENIEKLKENNKKYNDDFNKCFIDEDNVKICYEE